MNPSSLTATDLNFVLSRVPKDVRKLMREQGLFLAGGFIRATIANDERPSDIDLLGPNKEALKATAMAFALKRQARAHDTPNAITVLAPPRMPVQFILRWTYTDPERLLREFDFTIAQAVIWYDPEEKRRPTINELGETEKYGVYKSLCHPDFYADLASKRLVYTQPQRHEDAGGSMLRVRKFLARGYHIEADSLSKVIARLVASIDPDRLRDFTDEDATAFILRGLLREVDPAVIVDGVEIVDEHQINMNEENDNDNSIHFE